MERVQILKVSQYLVYVIFFKKKNLQAEVC